MADQTENHDGFQAMPAYFQQIDGQLRVGSKTCDQLAEELGTPFFAYDLGVAGQKLALLRDHLPEQVTLLWKTSLVCQTTCIPYLIPQPNQFL